MQAKLQDIVSLLNNYRSSHHIPGFTVSLIADGEIAYSQGFGTPHAESPYNLVTDRTLFSIQAITESFTASALLHLEEHSSFELDAPVVDYLPYFKNENGNHHSITTAQILSHSSGYQENYRITPLLDKGIYAFIKNLPDYKGMVETITNIDQIRKALATREDIAKYFADLKLKSKPGDQFYYYSDAYMIAAAVLEEVSGMSWEDYVSTYILMPLGLTETFINLPQELDKKRVAKYYMNGIGEPIETPTPHNVVGAPVGSIYTTAEDLSKYLMAHMAPGQFLSQTSLEKMQAEQVKIDEETGYGLGWKLRDFQGMKIVEQTGSYPGISSAVSFIPEEKFGLVLLCNTDMIRLDKLAQRIIKRVFS